MRILTVTSSYPKYKGDTTAPFIASITKALADRGHDLTMVLPARKDLDPEPIPGVRFHPFRYAPTEALSVFGYAESLRADVTLRTATYVAAPLALMSGARKLLAVSRGEKFDVLHAHWVVPNGAMAWLASKLRRLPLVVSLHGSDVFLSETRSGFRRAAKLAFSQAHAATACSEDLATRSLELGADKKPVVIPYGVDTKLFDCRPMAPRSKCALLAVGRLVHKKGFEYLVDAAAELRRKGRSFHLVIVGKGDLQPWLEDRVRDRGVTDQVDCVGNVERDALPGYFARADIVVVPSVRDASGNVDGLPNVVLEGMASGRAIVASEIGGIPQAIRDGRDGLLVPEKNAGALAAAIEKLMDSSELRRSLGSSARMRAEEEFSWKLVGERFESVLGAVAEARR